MARRKYFFRVKEMTVLLVAVCISAVALYISLPSSDLTSENQKSQVKEETCVTNDGNFKQCVDSPEDLTEDATKGDRDVNAKPDENEKMNETVTEEKSSEDGNSSESNTSEIQNEEKKTDDEFVEMMRDVDGKERSEDKPAEESENNTASCDDGTKTDESLVDKEAQKEEGQIEKNADPNQNKETGESLGEEVKHKDESSKVVFPSRAQLDLLYESTVQNRSWSTQAAESKKEKEGIASELNQTSGSSWKLCETIAGPNFIPCLDNLYAIRHLRSVSHFEHRERHCPAEPPTCLVPLPLGYKILVGWPKSRAMIWYTNVHTKLTEPKKHHWIKVSGEYLTFPGGGTQFKLGGLHYIEFIENIVRKQNVDFKWGKSSRVVFDAWCGVANFGGFLFEKDVLTMSFAPKRKRDAQVQYALERGIPAIPAVMGTTRLPFPGIVFDVVRCAPCRVPWRVHGGKLLLELSRVLRPGGFFIWSSTSVYPELDEDVEIWKAMSKQTKAMCWELIAKEKDPVNGVDVAVYRKPTTNECYEKRSQKEPPMCPESDNPNAAWNVSLQACMHQVPIDDSERGSHWPTNWPARVESPPYWLTRLQVGVYGKSAPQDFTDDYEHWKRVVSQSYLTGLGIDWSTVRNVMDMRSIYGGFAAALRDLKVWVMNVVTVDSPDTLPIIYERGLFGMYHDWCESFSTYPRSYDLLHADHLFSMIKKCSFLGLVAEVDRILRPGGKLIVRDNVATINELEDTLRSMKWQIRMTYSMDKEGLLCAQKTMWRPEEFETLRYAIARGMARQ